MPSHRHKALILLETLMSKKKKEKSNAAIFWNYGQTLPPYVPLRSFPSFHLTLMCRRTELLRSPCLPCLPSGVGGPQSRFPARHEARGRGSDGAAAGVRGHGDEDCAPATEDPF